MPEEPTKEELLQRIEYLERKVEEIRYDRDAWIIKWFRSQGKHISYGLAEMRERATLRRRLKDTLKSLEG